MCSGPLAPVGVPLGNQEKVTNWLDWEEHMLKGVSHTWPWGSLLYLTPAVLEAHSVLQAAQRTCMWPILLLSDLLAFVVTVSLREGMACMWCVRWCLHVACRVRMVPACGV